MSCTVIHCDQRSPEWYAVRAGLLTATGAAAMLSANKKNGEEPVGKTELRLRLALEALRGVSLDDDPYESDYMRRGREREQAGLDTYEAHTGEIVQRVGFLQHDTLPIGCSPDAIVGDFEGGVEMKCPKFTTHYAYLCKGALPNEYRAQVTHSLFVSGVPWWDFCSYCPEFDGEARLFRVRVFASEIDLDAYALAVAFFLGEVDQVKATVSALSGARETVHG